LSTSFEGSTGLAVECKHLFAEWPSVILKKGE